MIAAASSSMPARPSPHRRALLAIAAGGAIGACARYLLGPGPGRTLLINVVGSLLIGVLLVLVTRRGGHPLLRPFLGVGLLGGFTTFSTYAVDVRGSLAAGRLGVAAAYLLLTPVLAVLAAWIGTELTHLALGGRLPPVEQSGDL